MKKPHCDNCDELIVDAAPARQVTIQPHGFNCRVTLKIEKAGIREPYDEKELCDACLRRAAEEYAASIPRRPI